MIALFGKSGKATNGKILGIFPRRKAASNDGAPKDKRLRILVWAVLISVATAMVGLHDPFEELVMGGRDSIRARNSDGQIVVIGMDDRTISELGNRYFPRRHFATVVDKVFEMGGKRVFFDHLFQDKTNEFDDLSLANSFKRHKDNVFIASVNVQNNGNVDGKTMDAQKIFRDNANIVSVALAQSPIYGFITQQPALGDKNRVTMANMLAGGKGRGHELLRPDWSIRASSVPTYSFVDVLNGKIPNSAFEGKDIVIGAVSRAYNDNHFVVFQGSLPGLYGHVIGGETLKRGKPIMVGWIPAFLIALLGSAVLLYARSRRAVRWGAFATLFAIVALPIAMDELLLTFDVVPAFLLFAIVAYRGLSARRVLETVQTNSSSGLPNLVALRNLGKVQSATLIAMKIRNYAAISASFEDNVEQIIVAELQRRISFGSDQTEIYHADDTLFWFSKMEMGPALTNHLEGLNALANAALRIQNRMIDVQLAIGIDGDFDRPLTSRIGSALLCAQEAAKTNEIWKFYDPERQHQAAWQLSLVGEMENAISTGDLWVAYQPKYDLNLREIVGAEALARWSHPVRGMIPPDEFVIAAETHNRINRLTAFVLDQALEAGSKMRVHKPDFTMAVNLSAQLLESPSLLDMVNAALLKNNFPPENLVLEVTETAHLARSPAALQLMQDFRKLGIHISIDDYGTGNATMDYLKLLPSDEVKIDKSFVGSLDTSRDDRIMVQSTIELAHGLGRRVVAEGVERQAVLDQLVALGCDMIQGYLISAPVAADALIKQLLQKTQTVADHSSLAA